jgi:hypothetical protein
MSSEPGGCPFCGSSEVELVSLWGGQLITSQVRCRSCNTHFEAVRDDLPLGGPGDDALLDDPPAPWTIS